MPLKGAIRAKGGKRVEPNLPDIALRICKMAMIPAPKRVSGRLQNGGSCGTSTGHQIVNQLFAFQIMAQHGAARSSRRHTCLFRQSSPLIKAKRLAQKVKDNDLRGLINLAPAERRIKFRQRLRICGGKRDQRDAMFHSGTVAKAGARYKPYLLLDACARAWASKSMPNWSNRWIMSTNTQFSVNRPVSYSQKSIPLTPALAPLGAWSR